MQVTITGPLKTLTKQEQECIDTSQKMYGYTVDTFDEATGKTIANRFVCADSIQELVPCLMDT